MQLLRKVFLNYQRRCRTTIFSIASILALSGMICSCSGYNPNRGYAKHTQSIPKTAVPQGRGMKTLASKAYYPVPSQKGISINPTVSIEPPGSNLAIYRKPTYYRAKSGARAAAVTHYFTSGSNGVPLLILGVPAAKAWPIVANALARSPYRVMAKDRSISTFMITLPRGVKRSSSLAIYALHVYPQGSKQTVVSLTRNKQTTANSKTILKDIARYLS